MILTRSSVTSILIDYRSDASYDFMHPQCPIHLSAELISSSLPDFGIHVALIFLDLYL